MREHSEVLYVLHIALIEIRAAESAMKANVFADVVHNVPTMIRAGRTEEQIAANVMFNAKRHNVEEHFLELFEMARSK